MSGAGHTPGPWRIDTESMVTRCGGPRILNTSAADSRRVAIADLWDVDGIKGDTLANARLIAAAPELLAALRVFVERDREDPYAPVTEAQARTAREALAKAEGREP